VLVRRLQVERLRRSIAMLRPGARDAVGREDALRLLGELGDVQGRPRRPQAAAGAFVSITKLQETLAVVFHAISDGQTVRAPGPRSDRTLRLGIKLKTSKPRRY
jgi:hypothetical protein